MGFRITSRIKQWQSTSEQKLDIALLSMATDIHRTAVMNAPIKTGVLRSSGVINRLAPMSYEVRFGDSRVPYAKKRHEENKKNPQTILYLKRAGDYTTKNVNKYLRRA